MFEAEPVNSRSLHLNLLCFLVEANGELGVRKQAVDDRHFVLKHCLKPNIRPECEVYRLDIFRCFGNFGKLAKSLRMGFEGNNSTIWKSASRVTNSGTDVCPDVEKCINPVLPNLT